MADIRLPPADVALVRRWAERHVPDRLRHRIRIECELAAGHLTVVECQAPWHAGMGPEWTRHPILRLRYTKGTGTWALYYRDRNLRYHQYDPAPPSADVRDLLRAVDDDPTGIFWG